MTNILKPCPYRIQGVRRASWTVEGEYSYIETFMPCMGFRCGCFNFDYDIAYCDRGGGHMILAKDISIDDIKPKDGENK